MFLVLLLSIVKAILPSQSCAEEGELKLRGSVKTFLNAVDVTDFRPEAGGYNGGGDDGRQIEEQLQAAVRYGLLWKPSGAFSAEASYELSGFLRKRGAAAMQEIKTPAGPEDVERYQEAVARSFAFLSVSDTAMLPYRVADFGRRLLPYDKDVDASEKSFLLYQNLDRLFVTFSTASMDVSIGRQPVAFGSARVVNPTDVLTPFAYTAQDKEFRTGIDAVRTRVPLGAMSEIDSGVVCGKACDPEESAAFFRIKWNLYKADAAPIVIAFRENLLLGLDIASPVGDAGYWIEGAYVYDGAFAQASQKEDYWRVSTGMDYSFTGDLYGFIEYHYNGIGKSRPRDYAGLTGMRISQNVAGQELPAAYEDGGAYLLGRHYLAPGVTYQFTPLLSLTAQGLYNIEDRSALLSPSASYSLSNEAVIEAGAFIGIGKGPDIALCPCSGALSITPRSEFGLYPSTYFIAAKLYF